MIDILTSIWIGVSILSVCLIIFIITHTFNLERVIAFILGIVYVGFLSYILGTITRLIWSGGGAIMKKHDYESATKSLDNYISKLLKNTPTKYWHKILNDLHEISDIKHRNFIFLDHDMKETINKYE